jgi:phosphopantothenoylcysteine decarboxylase/phosphopantothenate--cysteine ligase
LKKVQTAQEMKEQVLKHFGQADIVIMAAAVSDFRFAQSFPQKIKKEKIGKEVRMVPTEDILRKVGEKREKKVLVGFAAETENVLKNAAKKMREKKLDLIVANDVSAEGIGFESDFNQVVIISPDGKKVETGRMSKLEISRIILDRIEERLGKKS